MLLWAIFAVLTAFAAVIIASPYWRRRAVSAEPRDLEVYKQQLAEIDDEQARGLLGQSEAEAARVEISRRILAASETAARASDAARPHFAPYVAIAILTIITMGTYLIYGSPNLPDQPVAARVSPDDQPSVAELVARVEERLRTHPKDGNGWNVLAPVYLRLGRYPEAANALKKSIELLGATPKRLGDLGEALTLANGGQVTDEAIEAFRKVLASEPQNDRAAFWLAMSDEQRGKVAEAKDAYRGLLERNLSDEAKAVVKERLAGLEQPAAAAGPSFTGDQSAMIDDMVQGLAKRLEADGSDLEGWLKLMRAYTVLGRREDALSALKNAERQFAGNPEALGQIDKMAKSLGIRS
jgi:cytochrome c-type biogenesis protein CcmH